MSASRGAGSERLRFFWHRLRPFFRHEKGRYAAGIVCDLLTLGATVLFPQLIRVIIDEGIQQGDMQRVNEFVWLLLAVLFVGAVATYARTYFLELAALRVSIAIRKWIFGNLIVQEMGFFDEQSTGELVARLDSDVNQLSVTLNYLGPELLHFSLLGLVAAGMMAYTAPLLAVVVLAAGPIIWVGSSALGRYMHGQSARVQESNVSVVQAGLEPLLGIQTVRVYNQEQTALGRYSDASNSLVREGRRQVRAHSLLKAFGELISQGTIALTIWAGALLIVGGSLSAGALVTFIFYSGMVMRSVKNVSNAAVEVMRAQGGTQRVFSLGERATCMPIEGGAVPAECTGVVRLEDVHFAYPTRPDAAALHGVNLEIPPGEILALVGASGSGKSTIAKLIARLYDPDRGSITLDGRDLRELDSTWLREQVTLVPAEATLFGCSVAENIRYGRVDASDEEVREAARAAHAAEFIEGLPDGYETDVGDAGRLFSNGQRQRIAIARAILRRPRVLILDEATAALDAEGEALVKESLRKLRYGPTVIFVSHRLSTIIDAERVIVVRQGQLVAAGSHEELLAESDFYRDLVETQLIGD